MNVSFLVSIVIFTIGIIGCYKLFNHKGNSLTDMTKASASSYGREANCCAWACNSQYKAGVVRASRRGNVNGGTKWNCYCKPNERSTTCIVPYRMAGQPWARQLVSFNLLLCDVSCYNLPVDSIYFYLYLKLFRKI